MLPVIILLAAPTAVGKHRSVRSSVSVDLLHFAHKLVRRQLFGFVRAFEAAGDLRFLIGIYEDIQRIMLLQNQVCTPPDDHTIALCRQFFDQLFLLYQNLNRLMPDVVGRDDMLADGRRI